jgi:hypothetical protein
LFVRRRRAAAASCVVDKSIDCPVPDFPFPITAFLSGTATKLLRILSPLLPFVCSLPLPRQPPLLPRQPFTNFGISVHFCFVSYHLFVRRWRVLQIIDFLSIPTSKRKRA